LKLHYVWANEFRHLENFEATLDSHSEYSFNREKCFLSNSKKQAIPKNFFGKKIVDLSCVIGLSGKTSVLEIICIAATKPTSLEEYVIVYENKGGLFYISNIQVEFDFEVIQGKDTDLEHFNTMFHSSKPEDYDLYFSDKVHDISITRLLSDNELPNLLEYQKDFIESKDSLFFTGKNKPVYKEDSGYSRWDGIDSLDLLYLDLLSLMFKVYDKKNKGKTTLVCVDNFDARMHPTGQIEFITKLIKFLPEITKGQVQIVISTNSALVLTDIPSQCLIQIDENDNEINTFGGNLYDVFKRTLQVKRRNGLVSTEYIKKACEIIDKKTVNITEEEFAFLEEASEIIGDQLIKHHIKHYLEDLNEYKNSL
jgi:hypothetical protein